MPRYRSDTPAARLRDAPARRRRRTRRRVATWAGSYLTVGLAALLAVALTAPGTTGGDPAPAQASSSSPGQSAPAPVGPDGLVHDPHRVVRPQSSGWNEVGPLLAAAVSDAADLGLPMAACVLAIDAPRERMLCAGDDEPRYAASVIKVAYAVGALEAWEGDVDADTPHGRLGDLVDQAITVSDNEAANLLYDLSVTGPDAPATSSPVEALNEIADRVGLADQFHTGGAFRYEWTGDWSRVSARGSARYLAELVRAADGRAPRRSALTSPGVARTVLAAMLEQERQWKLPALLPSGVAANKTGETDTESHDIALVNTGSGRYAIAVIAGSHGLFGGPDDIMAQLGLDLVRALDGAARF